MSTFNGTTGDDTLVGTSSSDTLNGLAGDDVLTGGGSSNRLNGGDGEDTLTGGGSYNYLYGGNDADDLTGGGTYNYLYGEGGDDILRAGGSNNYLYGGSGDDTLRTGDEDNVYLYGSSGDDFYDIQWSNASSSNTYYAYISDQYTSEDTLDLSGVVSGIEDLRFAGTSYDLYIYLYNDDGEQIGSITIDNHLYSWSDGAQIETLKIGNDTYDLTAGDTGAELTSLYVHGMTSGDDEFTGGDLSDTINGLGGDDTIVASSGSGSRVYGNSGNDVLTAGGETQYLYGGNGDDTLNTGDFDNVTLYGNDGDDLYAVQWESNSSSDTYFVYIDEYGYGDNDTLDLSSFVDDTDNLSFGGSYSDLYIYVYDDNENLTGTIQIDDQYNSYYSDYYQIETLVLGDMEIDLTQASSAAALNSIILYGASSEADTIVGTEDSENIYGLGGDDSLAAGGNSTRLYGDGGDDTLNGGDFDSLTLYGGDGNDTYILEWESHSSSDTFFVTLDEYSTGNDVLDISSFVDDISTIQFTGYYYNDLAIKIYDESGDLTGTIVIDDHYYGTSYQIETLIIGDQEIDLTQGTSAAALNSIILYGATDGDDEITGTSGNESLYGLEGDDTITSGGDSVYISGGEGADVLTAGGGSNSLSGSDGDDTLSSGDNDNIYMYGGYGDDVYVVDWESASSDDTYYVYISYDYSGTDTLDLSAVADSLDSLSFSGSYSSLYINVYDDDDNQVGTIAIDYQFYYDTIDTLIVGDDTLDLSAYDSGIEITSQLVYGTSNEDDDITVTAANESVYAYAGNDTITGGAEGQSLYGYQGDDLITAGGNSSYLHGGSDNDTLDAGNFDNVTLSGSSGDDYFTMNWSSASTDDQYYVSISDGYYYSSEEGDDTLDLSDFIDSTDNISFSGSYDALYINILDDDSNTIGRITITDQFDDYYDGAIETLILDDETIDLSAYSSYGELSSALNYATSDAADIISSAVDYDSIYTFGGNDSITLTGSYANAHGGNGDDTIDADGYDATAFGDNGDDVISSSAYYANLSGGAGDDTILLSGYGAYGYGGADDDYLVSESSSGYIYGEAGNDTLVGVGYSSVLSGSSGDDTYVIDWDGASANSNSYASIYDYNYSSDSGDDVLDLTGVAADLGNVSFGGYGSYDLYVYVLDDNGNTIGRITIDDQFYSYYDEQIETLRIGKQTFDLTAATSYAGLNSLLDDMVSDDPDNISGTVSADSLFGYGGDDTIDGGVGADYIAGGSGADALMGSGGADTIDGGTGNDNLSGGASGDILNGGSQDDTIAGGDGGDRISGGTHNDNISGEAGNDVIFGDHGADTIDGGDGTDAIQYLASGAGVTVDLSTGTGSAGQAAGDVISGIENINGSRASDHLTGDDGDNKFVGYGGWDTLEGGDGDDRLEGWAGHDILDGGAGNDVLLGGKDNDTLDGGAGDDTLTGGTNRDVFVFEAGTGDDTVTDFNTELDTLDLSATTTDFTDSASVEAAASAVDGGVLIDLGGGDSVLLEGLTTAELATLEIIF